MITNMKYILIVATLLSTSACTPAIKNALSSEWANAKDYHYTELLYKMSGVKKAQLTKKEKHKNHTNRLCFHTDAHERMLTYNGIEDAVLYRHCTLTDSLGNTSPSRLDGR